MNAPARSPITKLCEYVRTSERMNGIAVLFGDREAAKEATAARIVMVPIGGPFSDPDNDGNWADVQCAVECQCWGKDFDQLWEVVRRLLGAVRDYSYVGDSTDETAGYSHDAGMRIGDGATDCVRPTPTEIEFEEGGDTNRQGYFAAVTIRVVSSFESTPLAADSGTGEVEGRRHHHWRGKLRAGIEP